MPSRAALIVVCAMTLLRIALAANVPLTEDEAYYWSWSLHPAFGYVDHPPGVMMTILAFAWLGRSPVAIRFGFIIASALAALFAGAAARTLSGDRRAGTAATIAFALLPQLRLFVGEALPDGPYLLGWAATLYAATRAFARPSYSSAAFLGIALGVTMLSRFFGWALFFGVLAYSLTPNARRTFRSSLWIAFPIALVLYAPNVAWNATHDWINLRFSTHDRQLMHALWPPQIGVSTIRCIIYAVIAALVAYLAAIRPKYWLLAWTALPLTILMIALAPFETVESYWLLGPAASLIVACAIAYARSTVQVRRLVALAYAAPVIAALAAAAFPALSEDVQARLLDAAPAARGLYSPTASYDRLANQVKTLAERYDAAIFTDRYEIAAELLYHETPVQLHGNGLGVAQWEMWDQGPTGPNAVVFVRDSPIGANDDLRLWAERGWTTVRDAGLLQTTFAGREATRLYAIVATGRRTSCAHAQ